MRYEKVALTTDLGPGEKIKLNIEDKIILLANIDGAYYAIDNTCPHMGGSLFDGKLEGANVICPRHGSTFDVRTGKLVASGKLFLVKIKTADVKSYPVKIEGTDILLEIS
jgi:3-phenylpropionate/trans-cinnamate dioxygenase ferredoxin component